MRKRKQGERNGATQGEMLAAGAVTIATEPTSASIEAPSAPVVSASDVDALRELGQQRDARIPLGKRARLFKAGYLEGASKPYALTERARRVLSGGAL